MNEPICIHHNFTVRKQLVEEVRRDPSGLLGRYRLLRCPLCGEHSAYNLNFNRLSEPECDSCRRSQQRRSWVMLPVVRSEDEITVRCFRPGCGHQKALVVPQVLR